MWASALAFLLPLALYAATRAPDLTFIDSGELAAAAATLGIAHPTGYPLFTLAGRALVIFPGPLEPVARLTLFSAVCGAGAAAFTFASVRRILRSIGLGAAATAGALAAGLTLATGHTAWEQAVVVEVYALHLLFLAVLFYLALRAASDGGAAAGGATALLLFAYVAGLAIGNHLSAALLLPALAFLVVRERGAAGLGRALPVLALAFLLGLSIYAYLPLRSAREPLLDWGDPETPGAFYRHATGAVYRVWFLSSAQVAAKQLGRFLSLLPVEMSPLAPIPAVIGLVVLWRRREALAQATVLLFVLNLLYAVNYDIHDIDSYFLPAFLAVAIWVGIGVAVALDRGSRRLRGAVARRGATLAATLAVPVLALIWNGPTASQRGNHLVADYTAAMFRSLEPRAVILSRQWDHFCSASIYDQLVRGERRDVTVIEKELMRRRWYLKQLARWDPELTRPCRELMERFGNELVPFETGGRYSSERLQETYVGVINCLLEHAMETRPAYITPDALEPGIAGRLVQVPAGLALRLYREPPAELPPSPPPAVRGLAAAFSSAIDLRQQLAGLVLEMETRRALYLAQIGRPEEAMRAVEAVLAREPGYSNAQRLKELLSGRGGSPPLPQEGK